MSSSVRASREPQKAISDMRKASELIDNAADATAYQLGLVSLALMARKFLRDTPTSASPSDDGARQPQEVQIAERIARAAHAEQKDTVTGAPYITHVERVVAMVDGDEAKAVAWLHDVLEDCDEWAYDDLIREGISQRVCDAVDALTRTPQYSYAEYIEQIRVDKNPLVIAVKIADLRDHLRPNCPARLRPRYEAALKALSPAAASDDGAARPQPAQRQRDRMFCYTCAVVVPDMQAFGNHQQQGHEIYAVQALSSPSVADKPRTP